MCYLCFRYIKQVTSTLPVFMLQECISCFSLRGAQQLQPLQASPSSPWLAAASKREGAPPRGGPVPWKRSQAVQSKSPLQVFLSVSAPLTPTDSWRGGKNSPCEGKVQSPWAGAALGRLLTVVGAGIKPTFTLGWCFFSFMTYFLLFTAVNKK